MFKKGDKVICVRAGEGRYGCKLTKGRIYTLPFDRSACVGLSVLDDNGSITGFVIDRFEHYPQLHTRITVLRKVMEKDHV